MLNIIFMLKNNIFFLILLVLLGLCRRPWELHQVTTRVQMSTHQRRDSLKEENSIWERPVGTLALETVAPVLL